MNIRPLADRLRIAALLLGMIVLALMAVSTIRAHDTASTDVAGELLVYDWNKPVTKLHKGFPYNQPPMANGNWRSPINYAGGTMHYRVQIFSQPVPQNMRLQFCFWQFKFARETCSKQVSVYGKAGTVVTWSQPIGSMWKLRGVALDWTKPRYRVSAVIKDSLGRPVSNYNGWNWYGHNPDKWYPLNMRFTAVVVRSGKTFSGWSNYVR